jgi:glycerate dehydrogenase
MKYNIVVLDGHTLNPGDLSWHCLEEFGPLEVYPRSSPEEGLRRSQNANVLVVNKFVLDRDTLNQLPNLKYIAVSATGYNNVDIYAAKELNIPVSNVKGYSAASVAQHVFAVLLSYLHKPYEYHDDVRSGTWSKQPDFSYWNESFTELKEKILGIYGFGEIGKQVAKIALAFGMKVIVNTRTSRQDTDSLKFVSLDALFEEADILSLHAPQTATNKEFVSKNLLKKMKPEAIFINTARGTLIHEGDLFEALQKKWIRAAFLDVLQLEPPDLNHSLFKLDNCFITPHLAWSSKESRQRLLNGVRDNIKAYTLGVPNNIVY